MKLDDLRDLFPALREVTYLNTATAALGATPVVEALRAAEDEWASGEFSWQAWETAGAEPTRDIFARLVGGRGEHVGLYGSVSAAAASVAASLEPGRIVVGSREFQSNLFPWLALERRGFEVVQVPATEGVVRTDALIEAIDEGTMLVAVSEVQSANGFRVHLAEIAQACKAHGAQLFLDAIQSLGALEYVPGADYVASHGYKWLLAPRGAAWMWVTPDRLNDLYPLAPSWKNVPEPYADYYGGPIELPEHGRRLDMSLAWLTWPGALAALRIIDDLDPAEVEERCLSLAREFREEAGRRSFKLVPEDAPSQIQALSVPDPAALKARLSERRVIGAIRDGSFRVGFHAYNDERDLATALDALGRPDG
ncbi:MAG: aminotransferase class V-fold PLP-dependent enzyme [Actinomycetota bacterium]